MSLPFSAVVLAGGRSTRMGRDKALISVDGVPLWERQLRLVEQLEPTWTFLAGRPRGAEAIEALRSPMIVIRMHEWPNLAGYAP